MSIMYEKRLDDLEDEEWRDVIGREGEYQVSNRGRVKSLSRVVNTWNSFKTLPTIIMSQDLRNGYCRCKAGAVHRIVARAFCEGFTPEKVVNHLNGIRTDNRAENLEWCSPQQNILHAWETGLCNEQTRAKMSAKAKQRVGDKNSCWRGTVEISNLSGEVVFVAPDLGGAAEWVRRNTRYTTATKGNISLACNGKRGITKMYGHKFRYIKRGEGTP